MSDFKRVILKDPVTGDFLAPKVPGTLMYEEINGTEEAPFSTAINADTLNGKTADDFASSNHTHTPESIGAATKIVYTTTISTNWIADGDYFYQDIAVDGIQEDDDPDMDILPSDDNATNILYSEAICKVFRTTTFDNSIRVWATEAISTAFSIRLKVVR